MKSTLRIFIAFTLWSSLLSCSPAFVSDDDGFQEKSQTENLADYLMLQPGNYWVYESHIVEAETDRIIPLNKYDSLYVATDTLIGHKPYAVLRGTWLGEPFEAVLRTSGGDLIDANGRLLFTLHRLNDTTLIEPALLPAGARSGWMTSFFAPAISVPYGTFDALALLRTLSLAPDPDGNFPAGQERQESLFYAKGIGLIQYSSQLQGYPARIEMRLTRCRVR
jgi:hypothetical protein